MSITIYTSDNMEGMSSDYEDFFKNTPAPSNHDEVLARIRNFVQRHAADQRRIVLVTSGGTTVPLESRTVRYIDNFSIGNRGAISAEYFLSSGYAVIFLHRRRSLEPFNRHFQNTNLLDVLCLQDGLPAVRESHRTLLSSLLSQHSAVCSAGTLLSVDFTTLSDYLHYLQGAAQCLAVSERRAMLYLAAAVSDFYIPITDMAEHKIQSSNGPLQVQLQLVPKMLRPLVHDWVPRAFIVSFKLETDPSLLMKKSKQALSTYHHQVVVGNILETRKREVVVVTGSEEKWIRLTDSELHEQIDIEQHIVEELVRRHTDHIAL